MGRSSDWGMAGLLLLLAWVQDRWRGPALFAAGAMTLGFIWLFPEARHAAPLWRGCRRPCLDRMAATAMPVGRSIGTATQGE
jgi:hypothetical protein